MTRPKRRCQGTPYPQRAGRESNHVTSSHRQILRSSWIIGGASLINIVVGVLRQKALALLLGPAGVGLVGLFQSVVTMCAAVAGMGVGNAGTRQIAEAAGDGDPRRLAVARKALFRLTLLLALVGAAALWLLRHSLAEAVFRDPAAAASFGILALAVALTIGAASQLALLVGMQRIGDVARVTVLSALVSTVAGVAAVALYRERALLFFVVSAPIAAIAVGWIYTARLAGGRAPSVRTAELAPQWRAMLALGIAATVAGLASTGSQLVARAWIQRELGPVPLGAFQAASVITVTYLGFVLQAMSTDYYPRLTKAIGDRAAANRLVNEQAEIALMLGGPILLVMMGAAPAAVTILYSSKFAGAADLLRIQVFADVLRLMSWPLGYLLLALGAGKTYVAAESAVAAVFLLLLVGFVGPVGLEGAGLALVGMYLAYLPFVTLAARRFTGFRWAPAVLGVAAVLLALCAATYALTWFGNLAAFAGGCLSAAAFALLSLHRLRSHMPERLSKGLAPLYRLQERLKSVLPWARERSRRNEGR